jgi:hypothetical protein
MPFVHRITDAIMLHFLDARAPARHLCHYLSTTLLHHANHPLSSNARAEASVGAAGDAGRCAGDRSRFSSLASTSPHKLA